jgi:3-deoxy-manno-octulosonate cytidylyltransferase (CMP-KDO synthetase)
MRKNIIIIPARFKSIRFPGKPLEKISGKSMIQFIYDSIKNYNNIDEIIVATDDEKIANHCKENNIPCSLTSDTHQSGTDRVAEVACRFPADTNIINLQGDEPFVKETDILKLIETLNCATDGIATLACPIKDDQQRKNPNRVKVVFNNRREAMYFSRYDLPYRKNESDEELSFQHIGIYGFKNEVLQILTKLPAGRYEKAESLEQLRWMEEGYKINLGFVDDSLFSVDTPEDLLEANKLVK